METKFPNVDLIDLSDDLYPSTPNEFNEDSSNNSLLAKNAPPGSANYYKNQIKMYTNKVRSLEKELRRQSGQFIKRETDLLDQVSALFPDIIDKSNPSDVRALESKQSKTWFPELKSEVLQVVLNRNESGSLGFNIAGGKSDNGSSFLFVTKILDSGPARDQGHLRVYDRLLEVNSISLLNVTHEEAIEACRNAKNPVCLKVARVICDENHSAFIDASTQTDLELQYPFGYPHLPSLPSTTDLESIDMQELDASDKAILQNCDLPLTQSCNRRGKKTSEKNSSTNGQQLEDYSNQSTIEHLNGELRLCSKCFMCDTTINAISRGNCQRSECKRSKTTENLSRCKTTQLKSKTVKYPHCDSCKLSSEQKKSKKRLLATSRTFDTFSSYLASINELDTGSLVRKCEAYLKMLEQSCELSTSSQEHETDESTNWKVKIRADGTRYITKGAGNNRSRRVQRKNITKVIEGVDETQSDDKFSKDCLRNQCKRRWMTEPTSSNRTSIISQEHVDSFKENVQTPASKDIKKRINKRKEHILDHLITMQALLHESTATAKCISISNVQI